MIEIKLYSEDLKDAILNLKDCSNCNPEENMIFIPESDYGFAQIYRMFDDYLVFLIPTYGGTPGFYKCYGLHAIDYLIKDLRDIT